MHLKGTRESADIATLKATRIFEKELLKLKTEYGDALVQPTFLLNDLIGNLEKAIKDLESDA